jgi:hypothetical protein
MIRTTSAQSDHSPSGRYRTVAAGGGVAASWKYHGSDTREKKGSDAVPLFVPGQKQAFLNKLSTHGLEGVCSLVLNRPESKNAVSVQLLRVRPFPL